jgi:hypothetical protein
MLQTELAVQKILAHLAEQEKIVNDFCNKVDEMAREAERLDKVYSKLF